MGTRRTKSRQKVATKGKTFRMRVDHEIAVQNWTRRHAHDETMVFKVGAFMFMCCPPGHRNEAIEKFLDWESKGYPPEALNWPEKNSGDEESRMPDLQEITKW